MASAVYVLNDLMDIEADRAHPVKYARPLPSGRISKSTAKRILIGLLVIAIVLSLLVNEVVTSLVASYLVLNIFYSWRLKHIVILDVFLISAGFMLRILAGTAGLSITPSAWLLLCGFMVTLFLGFAKRRAELLATGSGAKGDNGLVRRVLDDYNSQMLELFIAITAACTIIAYGLYTVSPSTVAIHGTTALIYTLPFVVYGIFRSLFLLHRHGKGNDTAKDLLQDYHLLTTVAAWLASTLWILR